MTNPIVIKQNKEFAYAVLAKLVGGSVEAYFESGSTIGAIMTECETNPRIQQLATNCILGSFDKAKSNREKLEAELRAVFGLERALA
jgi:hypothetical protein